jgi:hypothetical protein
MVLLLRQVNKEGVNTRMLLEELVLMNELMRQEECVTYEATLRGQRLVAKLPAQLTTPTTTMFTNTTTTTTTTTTAAVIMAGRRGQGGGVTLDMVMKRYEAISVEVFAKARFEFMRECRRAEKVLDPPSERIIRDYHHNHHDDNAPFLSAVECDVIAKGRQRWRNDWPGYAHMHPIVHFDPNIPLLLSESAQGTICDLRFLLKEEDPRPSREWLDVAWQLSEAITFLRFGPKMAHTNLTPYNVFYTTKSDGRLHIWLGDYGLVKPAAARRRRRRTGLWGTPLYVVEATYDQQQLFAYYATLLDLICFPSALVDADWLSRTGGNVSAGLSEAICTHSPLVTRASPELYAHIMAPLLTADVPLSALSQRFGRTREWLIRGASSSAAAAASAVKAD